MREDKDRPLLRPDSFHHHSPLALSLLCVPHHGIIESLKQERTLLRELCKSRRTETLGFYSWADC